MDRKRQIAIGLGIAVVAFLAGFAPQWARANRTSDRLEVARAELDACRTEGKIAAALTESLRSNYERSRQLMTEVYSELQAMSPRVDERQRRELGALLAQRDEIITLLARAAPESSQRLMLIHTRYRAAMHGEPAPQQPETPTPAS
jgi:biopolymer transport protein ExbB/TolQ